MIFCFQSKPMCVFPAVSTVIPCILVDRDKSQILSLISVASLDELVDLVVARQPTCGCVDHRDCDLVVVPVDVGWLWFFELALVVWRRCCVFEFAAERLCFELVVVFRGGVDVVCSCCLLYVHHRADRNVSMC